MFKINKTAKIVEGQVIYRKNEHSFDFEPAINTDYSLMIGNLYLGFDSESMLARQIWGYHPSTGWINKGLVFPTSFPGGLQINQEIEVGMTHRLVNIGEWKTYYDPKTGWICIGDDKNLQDDISIEFATDSIAVLSFNKLKSIWLKPIFE